MDGRKAIGLFSGAGGLDMGLRQAGIDVVVGQDFDPLCVRTLEANGVRALGGDVRGISAEALMEAAGVRRGEAFLVCGGPPCQPFSTAGRRLGVADPRGSLFVDFARLVDGVRPRFLLLENVKGLLSAGRALDVVLEEFGALGYRLVWGVLDAVDFGVPEFRQRFVLLGSRDGEPVSLPAPTHFGSPWPGEPGWRTLRDAVGDLHEDCPEVAPLSEERLRFLRLVPEGGNWRDLPADVAREAMGGAFGSSGGRVGFFRRLSFDRPSPTLLTSPVQKATLLGHPTEDRVLSVREYARIQQFPDDWVLCGGVMDRYRQIGNAVPVGLGRAIGRALLSVADGGGR